MSAKYLIGSQAFSLDYDDKKQPFTKVRIVIDPQAEPYEYGTNDGRVLEISNPWISYPPGSGETRDTTKYTYADTVAQDILSRINGYEYQPFDAQDAFLPDAAELGDAVYVGGVYGAVVTQDIDFNALGTSDISAPNGDEVENEFGTYVPSADNSMEGQIARLRTSFIVQYGLIRSEISEVESDLSTAIEQRLDSISLTVSSANGTTSFVLKDGTTTLDTETLQLNVAAANISGTLNANQINATDLHVSAANIDGNLRAGALYGGSVGLYDTAYISGEYVDTIRGSFDLTGTETGIGVVVNSRTGLKLAATTNVFLSAGSGGALTLRDNHLTFTSAGINLSSMSFGSSAPSGTGNYGELYFQIVS